MPGMSTGSTFSTAILRGFYNFLCTSLFAGITAYLGAGIVIPNGTDVPQQNMITFAVLTGALAGLSALGFRGGVEGAFDAMRDAKGDVNGGDVGQPPAQQKKRRAAAAKA